MRLSKVALINNDGKVVNLNNIRLNDIWRDINGLGYELDTNYKKIGNEYILLNKSYNQMQIKGTIDFIYNQFRYDSKTPQKKYQNFIRFITNTPLKIMYQPVPFTGLDNYEIFYRDGEITEVNFDETKTKKVDITFTTTGLWYRKLIAISNNQPVENDNKTYNYTYNYKYGGNSQNNTVTFILGTYIPSPFKLIASGSLVNPVWTYYNNGKYVASGKINYTIPEGYKLVIDTNTKTYGLYMINNNGEYIQNLYNYSDFSTLRFFDIQEGTNEIVITDDYSNTSDIIIEVCEYHASV